MNFREWLRKEIKVDSEGNKIEGDNWFAKAIPGERILRLRGQPQSVNFLKVTNGLSSVFPDIRDWEVDSIGYSYPRTQWWSQFRGVRHNRTVDYWLNQARADSGMMPRYIYHGTSTSLLDSIEREGIKPRQSTGTAPSYGGRSAPSKSNRVYFSFHPDAAARSAAYDAAREHGGHPLILKISSHSLDKSKIRDDEDMPDSMDKIGTFSYEGSVSGEIQPFLKAIRDKSGRYKWVRFDEFSRMAKIG